MRIRNDRNVDRFGESDDKPSMFSKFKYTTDNKGNKKYKTRETQSNKYTRDLYNFKGQIIFLIRVEVWKKYKNTKIRDSMSNQEVIVERSHLHNNFKDTVENAKLQAIYSHYSEQNKRDQIMTTDTRVLNKSEMVKTEILDYMINYHKKYVDRNTTEYVKFEKDEDKNLNVYRYNIKQKQYNLYSSVQPTSKDDVQTTFETIRTAPEETFIEKF
jgi:hypothetical protein